jgi:hypothetical protein
MGGKLGFSFLDWSEETASMALATGNITAVSLPGVLTQIGALRTAIQGIILGTITDERLSAFDTALSNTVPADELAQVESCWLVQYEDNLPFFDDPVNAIPNAGFHKIFTMTIPTAGKAGRCIANTDTADLANAQVAAFVTAFEAIARSPYGGTVNVLGLEFVGRNR